MTRDEQERRYAELMGDSRLQRQKAIAEGTCPECWQCDGRHHTYCKRRPGTVAAKTSGPYEAV